jgi:hypothetical protein
MREFEVIKSKENGKIHLEIGFKTVDQLLDESDPYPLPRKELTEFAEESIAENLYAIRIRDLDSLTISLPKEAMTDEIRSHLPDTIRRHYRQRLCHLENQKTAYWREQRISLFLAVFNIIVLCLFIAIFHEHAASPLFLLLSSILTILNWVTIWRTYEIFVYDMRRMNRKRKIYKKISTIKIQIKEKKSHEKNM